MFTEEDHAEWERLDRIETGGLSAVCDARLDKGDLILNRAPIGGDRTNNGSKAEIEAFAERHGTSVGSVIEYRAVAAYCHGSMRREIRETGVAVSYTTLRDVALRTDGEASDPERRFDALMDALMEAREARKTRITVNDYRRHLGVAAASNTRDGMPGDRVVYQLHRPEVRQQVTDALKDDDEAARAIASAYVSRSPSIAEAYPGLAEALSAIDTEATPSLAARPAGGQAEGLASQLRGAAREMAAQRPEGDGAPEELARAVREARLAEEEPDGLTVITKLNLLRLDAQALVKMLEKTPTGLSTARLADIKRLCGSVRSYVDEIEVMATASSSISEDGIQQLIEDSKGQI